MNPKLGIVILHFTNLPVARKFYSETLGLSVIAPQSDDHFVTLQSGGDSLIGLLGEPGKPQAGATEIGFEVSDADRVYAAWKAQGVTLLTEPGDFPFGRSFDALDPEGHRLSIYTPPARN